jgi:hypothetical protein
MVRYLAAAVLGDLLGALGEYLGTVGQGSVISGGHSIWHQEIGSRSQQTR